VATVAPRMTIVGVTADAVPFVLAGGFVGALVVDDVPVPGAAGPLEDDELEATMAAHVVPEKPGAHAQSAALQT